MKITREAKMDVEIKRFPAIAENGDNFMIIKYLDIIIKGNKDGAKTNKRGPFFKTMNGYEVKQKSKGVYWIKEMNIQVISDDPKAF